MNEFLKTKMGEYKGAVDDFLRSYFSGLEDIPGELAESMLYSVFAGGKRIRPALLLGTYSMFCSGPLEKALPFAAALEMIHTYSLIHDDLPSMDDDDTRRGRPSSHIVFGESGAILAGDALLNSAVEIMLCELGKGTAERATEAAVIIMKASGISGMIGGQVLDMRGAADAEGLYRMHMMKTGALIKAAIMSGAALGGGEESGILEEYADNLGCAFQIKDDILDVEGSTASLGKPGGSDAKNYKTTYVTLYGLEGAAGLLNVHTEKALSALDGISGESRFLRELALFVRDRKD